MKPTVSNTAARSTITFLTRIVCLCLSNFHLEIRCVEKKMENLSIRHPQFSFGQRPRHAWPKGLALSAFGFRELARSRFLRLAYLGEVLRLDRVQHVVFEIRVRL